MNDALNDALKNFHLAYQSKKQKKSSDTIIKYIEHGIQKYHKYKSQQNIHKILSKKSIIALLNNKRNLEDFAGQRKKPKMGTKKKRKK